MYSADPGQTGKRDLLVLYPGGYPVEIDVSEAQLGGLGVAMHFLLPLHGHNFPLMHSNEHKLVVALEGNLSICYDRKTLARLHCGQAVLIPPHGAHRIHQDGPTASVVGVVLWPGAIERAFREVAALVAAHGFQRKEVIDLFARYQVHWDTGTTSGGSPITLEPSTFVELLPALPPELATASKVRWTRWLDRC